MKPLRESRLPADADLPNKSEFVFASSSVAPAVAAPRYEQMGLRLENNRMVPAGNSTALTRRVQQLKDDHGIELVKDYDGIKLKIGNESYNTYWSEADFLSSPTTALKKVEEIRARAIDAKAVRSKGLTIAQDRYVAHGGTMELIGSKYGNETDRLIYELRTKSGLKIMLDDKLDGALGVSFGSGKIALLKSYALAEPAKARGTLLHEAKHASSDRLVNSDRLISFHSEQKGIPVGGYSEYMRADEVEARLPQASLQNIEALKSARTNTRRQTLIMIDAQEKMLKSIKPFDLSNGKLEANWSTSNFIVETRVDGAPVTIRFPVPEGQNQSVYVDELIKKRLKYLESLKNRL